MVVHEPMSPLAVQLQRLLAVLEASGRTILPNATNELLDTIVEAAARLFGAAAASVALVNEKESMLEFKVAYGTGRDHVVGMKIPLDQGIAGYVVMTGEPLAISNVQQDPRFASDTAIKTGYVPRSILAMPLLLRDRVIGVMEVLDKISAPTFGMQDMELLGLFARQAAIAIEQSHMLEHVESILVRGLRELVQSDATAHSTDLLAALETTADPQTQMLAEIAQRLSTLAALGEREQALALRWLDALADYARQTEP